MKMYSESGRGSTLSHEHTEYSEKIRIAWLSSVKLCRGHSKGTDHRETPSHEAFLPPNIATMFSRLQPSMFGDTRMPSILHLSAKTALAS